MVSPPKFARIARGETKKTITQTNKDCKKNMSKLIEKRNIVLRAFEDMGASPSQLFIEKIKTIDPGYVQSWLACISQ